MSSSVGLYGTYYQQASQTYTVPATGCEHKDSSGCTQSAECCYCSSPVSISAGLSGNMLTMSKYCAPCHGFWQRRVETAGKAKASTGTQPSRESPDQAGSPALRDMSYFSRLNAPFSSVPYIPPPQPNSRSRSISAAAPGSQFKSPPAAPALQPQNVSQNAKKRPRPEQHKHSNSESSAGQHKRSGGEGSSAGGAPRAGAGGEQAQSTARPPYVCPAVRAMNSRNTAVSMGNGVDRRWTLANPYGIPGGVQLPQSNSSSASTDNNSRLRPAGTCSNHNGGFQTYKPPSPTYPQGHNPINISTTPGSSRNNGSYQNYKPPKGPNYQPYRPGATSTPASPNDSSSTSPLNATPQPRETGPGNTNTPSNARSNSISTPLAIVTAGGDTTTPGPPTRNPNRNLPGSPGPGPSPTQGSQNRTASSLRLGDNTISTRSDSAPRAGVPVPQAERLRTRSWDGAPIHGPPDELWATQMANEFLPPAWAVEASAAGPAISNEQNSISTNSPVQSPAPQRPQNQSSGDVSTPNPAHAETTICRPAPVSARPSTNWLDWNLPNTPSFPQESAPTISWGSGDTRRNTVAGSPQSQNATPDSPTVRRKLVVSSRTARPFLAGQLVPAALDTSSSPYSRYPPPMETAIPPQQAPPAFLMGNATPGWLPSGANVHIQRRQADPDPWSIDGASAFLDFDAFQQAQPNRQEQALINRRREQAQASQKEDVNSRWGIGSVPRPVEGHIRRGSVHTGHQEHRTRRNRSPRNQSPRDRTPPQDRSPQNRSPRQRGRHSPYPPASPPIPPLIPQLIELAEAVAPQPGQGQSQSQPQPRASASSTNLAPTIPPIPSARSSPSEEWETWDQAWTAAANEIIPNQPDVGRMAEDASVLLELFHKTKPRRNAEIGDEHKQMIENAYKSIIEIKKEINMLAADDSVPAAGNAPAVSAPAARKRDDSQNADDCIVCFNNNADTVLLPCKHMVLCGGCCDKMNFRERNSTLLTRVYCPVCRAVVDDRMKIFRG